MLKLEEGEIFEIPLLPSQISSRVKEPETMMAAVELIKTESISVPAGSFDCELVEVSHAAGKDQFWFETNFPKRLIKWKAFHGDLYELLESKNLAYWELNKPGDEKYLPER
jgi:hypothetical protein